MPFYIWLNMHYKGFQIWYGYKYKVYFTTFIYICLFHTKTCATSENKNALRKFRLTAFNNHIEHTDWIWIFHTFKGSCNNVQYLYNNLRLLSIKISLYRRVFVIICLTFATFCTYNLLYEVYTPNIACIAADTFS